MPMPEIFLRCLGVVILWGLVSGSVINYDDFGPDKKLVVVAAVSGLVPGFLFAALLLPSFWKKHRSLQEFKVGSYAFLLKIVPSREMTRSYFGVHAVFMPIDSGGGAVLVVVPDEFERFLKDDVNVPIRFVQRSGQMQQQDLDKGIIPIVLSDFAPPREMRRPPARGGVFQAQ